jgi:hypothetical protein
MNTPPVPLDEVYAASDEEGGVQVGEDKAKSEAERQLCRNDGKKDRFHCDSR